MSAERSSRGFRQPGGGKALLTSHLQARPAAFLSAFLPLCQAPLPPLSLFCLLPLSSSPEEKPTDRYNKVIFFSVSQVRKLRSPRLEQHQAAQLVADTAQMPPSVNCKMRHTWLVFMTVPIWSVGEPCQSHYRPSPGISQPSPMTVHNGSSGSRKNQEDGQGHMPGPKAFWTLLCALSSLGWPW